MTEASSQTAPPANAAEAAARLNALTSDKEWGGRLLANDAATVSEFYRLSEMAAGDDKVATAMAGTAKQPFLETLTGNEISTRDTVSLVEDMRAKGVSDGAIKQLLEGHPVTQQEFDATKQLQARLHGDREWVSKLLKGDHEAARQFTLMSIILSSDIAESQK